MNTPSFQQQSQLNLPGRCLSQVTYAKFSKGLLSTEVTRAFQRSFSNVRQSTLKHNKDLYINVYGKQQVPLGQRKGGTGYPIPSLKTLTKYCYRHSSGTINFPLIVLLFTRHITMR